MFVFTVDANTLDATIALVMLIIFLPPFHSIIRGERTRLR